MRAKLTIEVTIDHDSEYLESILEDAIRTMKIEIGSSEARIEGWEIKGDEVISECKHEYESISDYCIKCFKPIVGGPFE